MKKPRLPVASATRNYKERRKARRTGGFQEGYNADTERDEGEEGEDSEEDVGL